MKVLLTLSVHAFTYPPTHPSITHFPIPSLFRISPFTRYSHYTSDNRPIVSFFIFPNCVRIGPNLLHPTLQHCISYSFFTHLSNKLIHICIQRMSLLLLSFKLTAHHQNFKVIDFLMQLINSLFPASIIRIYSNRMSNVAITLRCVEQLQIHHFPFIHFSPISLFEGITDSLMIHRFGKF